MRASFWREFFWAENSRKPSTAAQCSGGLVVEDEDQVSPAEVPFRPKALIDKSVNNRY
jgi:hypothetical protein